MSAARGFVRLSAEARVAAAEDTGGSEARPRLAYVVNSLNPGGTEKLVLEMSLAFARHFELFVVCLDDPGVWGRELRERGITVYCVWRQPGLDLSMPQRLARLFREHRVQIVHAHQCTPWFYAALSRLFYSAPRLLLEEHGRFFPERMSRSRVLINKAVIRRLTHKFVGVSQDIRSRLQRYEGVDARRVDVVYNGVSPQAPLAASTRQALRLQMGFEDRHFVVGTVGRFDPIKNLPMLLDSLAEAGGTVPGIRGLLVGDGPEMPAVRQRLERDGHAHRVHLTGFRGDARVLIQCMDLFVLSSFSEGTSMALLEAMSAGIAVAVTRVGGNPELVSAGSTGWVVESGDVAALSAAIGEAARDPVKRERLAKAGQERFLERFTFDCMIASYHRYYRELLADPACARAA